MIKKILPFVLLFVWLFYAFMFQYNMDELEMRFSEVFGTSWFITGYISRLFVALVFVFGFSWVAGSKVSQRTLFLILTGFLTIDLAMGLMMGNVAAFMSEVPFILIDASFMWIFSFVLLIGSGLVVFKETLVILPKRNLLNILLSIGAALLGLFITPTDSSDYRMPEGDHITYSFPHSEGDDETPVILMSAKCTHCFELARKLSIMGKHRDGFLEEMHVCVYGEGEALDAFYEHSGLGAFDVSCVLNDDQILELAGGAFPAILYLEQDTFKLVHGVHINKGVLDHLSHRP